MMGKWQKLVFGVVVVGVLVAVGAWAFWPKSMTEAGDQQTTAPTATQTATPSPPTETELQAVEAGIASSDPATVLQLLGEPSDGTVAPEALAQLKAMAIQLDPSTLRQIGEGPAWELTAKDASGQSWRVGFLRKPYGQLVVAYQEPVQ